MRRFDLGMSIDYCPNWGVVEAVREFFQNALDAQTVSPENTMYFEYVSSEQVLRIGNRNGSLGTNTLLLGQSSKRSDSSTIGQHGEGYKVATVVLLRNEKSVTVYNRGSKEVWFAKVVKSRRYNADVCVFDIEKVSTFKSVPNHDLIFEIGNITEAEYEAIKDSNLHLQKIDAENIIEADGSRILLDQAHSGKIYVNGLFVCKSKVAKYGYDIKPALMKLDRDRGLVDSYDLQFALAKIICATGNTDFIHDVKELWDGQYIRFYLNSYLGQPDLSALFDRVYNEFTEKHGEGAVPVTSTEEFNRLKANGYNAVLVSESNYHYITNSSSYSDPCAVDEGTKSNSVLADELESWFSEIKDVDQSLYDSGEAVVLEVLKRLREN